MKTTNIYHSLSSYRGGGRNRSMKNVRLEFQERMKCNFLLSDHFDNVSYQLNYLCLCNVHVITGRKWKGVIMATI